jgi:pyruvate kinase
LPNTHISLPSLTDKDLRDLQLGIRNHVDWIALSFVRTPEDILVLRQILKDNNCPSRIIAKIEKPEALINIDKIIEVSDAIMVARGDLGVEIPIEEVPFWQKTIVAKCNAQAKPVIVATQMLDSMIENARPTRAEATDVANAVFDGADALMLSGETSTGKYPVEAVKTMQRIIAKAEESDMIYHRNYDSDPNSDTFYSDVTCNIAVRFAEELNAKAIISLTQSGYTAFQLSKRRPKANIFIFTSNRPLLDTLNLVWGVQAYYYDGFEGTNQTIQDVIDILKKDDAVQPGDIVINTASIPIEERGRTNMVKYTVVK